MDTNTPANSIGEAAAWCATYADFSLTLAYAFLILAFLVALVETTLALWVKLQAARKGPDVTEAAVADRKLAVDPVKLLEALKGLLEALKGLPAWVAIFLAGLALLWTSASATPSYCSSASTTEPVGNSAQTNVNEQ